MKRTVEELVSKIKQYSLKDNVLEGECPWFTFRAHLRNTDWGIHGSPVVELEMTDWWNGSRSRWHFIHGWIKIGDSNEDEEIKQVAHAIAEYAKQTITFHKPEDVMLRGNITVKKKEELICK